MKTALKLTACMATLLAFAQAATAAEIKLRVIETTDIHSYLTAYDYYQNKPVKDYGFTLAASLVKKARSEVQNSVTVDNGDLIQGSLIGEYAQKNLKKDQVHPVYLAMNKLGYDAANIGNHEFNFGLDYLNRVLKGANFPYVNSNVYFANDPSKHYFKPYVIIPKEVVDTDGNKHTIKIGYIGFTPPGIMKWDADKLTGKVVVEDIYETAKKYVPQMKAEGADVVLAIPHSGVGSESFFKLAENASAWVAKVPGVNAVLFGHSHAVFPSKTDKAFNDIVAKGIADMDRGTLNGVPAVMPGHWGSHVGVVDLVLEEKDGKWVVNNAKGKAEARPVYDSKTKKAVVEADPEIQQVLDSVHKEVVNYTNRRFGTVAEPIYGFLSLTQDDDPVKLVNQAQLWYLQNWVAQNPNYKNHKLLSAAAPFKFGHRHDNPDEFIRVEKGPFTLRNVADVYVYPNTFNVVEATGQEIKDWIECSTNMFHTVDVNNEGDQEILDYTKYRTYNYDTLYGVTYQIDLTKDRKFGGSCKLRDVTAGRVVNLKFNGQEVKPTDKFLVATNNYRANGGTSPGTGRDHLVYEGTETNQEVIQQFVEYQEKKFGAIKLDKTENWSFAPIPGGEKLKLKIFTAPSEQAVNWVQENSVWKLTKLGLDNAGFQEWYIDLSKRVK